MGNCFCCSSETEFIRIALKLPNGLDSIRYDHFAKDLLNQIVLKPKVLATGSRQKPLIAADVSKQKQI